MRDKLSVAELPINASPAADHRRQMLMQVWLPLGVSIAVVLALVILAIVGAVRGSPQVERFGNLSAVLIIIPVMFTGVLVLAIVGGLAYGVTKLLGKMPNWMLRAQLFMIHLSLSIRRAANAAAKPVIATNTFSARVRAFWRKVIISR